MQFTIRIDREGASMTTDPPTRVDEYFAQGNFTGGAPFDIFNLVTSQAMQAIPTVITTPMGLLYRQNMRVTEVSYPRMYSISVPYGEKQKESGAYSIRFSQTGGTVNTKAGQLIASYAAEGKEGNIPEAPEDGVTFIGPDISNNTIVGADIPVSESKVIVSFRHPGGVLNGNYINAISDLVGFPNSDPFLIYQPGEVLFMGGDFEETNAEASATYNFAISKNRRDFKVGDVTVGEKAGHDVLSIIYKDDTQVARKIIDYIEVVRPAGRNWIPYKTAFGWG